MFSQTPEQITSMEAPQPRSSMEGVHDLQDLEYLLYDLADMYRRYQQQMKSRYKLSSLDVDIIHLIVTRGQKKMKEIGDYFQVKLSTLTSIIDKLERQEYVRRTSTPDDRRVVFLEVTRKGKSVHEQYAQYFQLLAEKAGTTLDDDQFESLILGLKKIVAASHMTD